MIEKWITSIGPLAALFSSETTNIGPLLGAKTYRSFRLSAGKLSTASCGPARKAEPAKIERKPVTTIDARTTATVFDAAPGAGLCGLRRGAFNGWKGGRVV
jgi:hypothetical protein